MFLLTILVGRFWSVQSVLEFNADIERVFWTVLFCMASRVFLFFIPSDSSRKRLQFLQNWLTLSFSSGIVVQILATVRPELQVDGANDEARCPSDSFGLCVRMGSRLCVSLCFSKSQHLPVTPPSLLCFLFLLLWFLLHFSVSFCLPLSLFLRGGGTSSSNGLSGDAGTGNGGANDT